jgi:GTPase SAR1 family protein
MVVVGSSFTGKSSLIVRFADDIFEEKYHNTIGVDFVSFEFMKKIEEIQIIESRRQNGQTPNCKLITEHK